MEKRQAEQQRRVERERDREQTEEETEEPAAVPPPEEKKEKSSLFRFRRKKASDEKMPSMFPAPGVNDPQPTLLEAGLFEDVAAEAEPAPAETVPSPVRG